MFILAIFTGFLGPLILWLIKKACYFYGVPDSGGLAPGHLLVSAHSGPAWLSGGSAGPEGSVLVFVVIAILAFVLSWIFPSTPPPELHRLRRQTQAAGPAPTGDYRRNLATRLNKAGIHPTTPRSSENQTEQRT